jgi:RHS repeat-associated protein
MSTPSGTADEILNLPSGGGAVSSAETGFNVDLNTGTLSVSVQLNLPTGPNGVAPQIGLQYSSESGDGPFGRGWSLGTLMILRKLSASADTPDPTATGYYSMTGVGDLVDMGNGRFRPTVDSTGQLIEFADGSWTVTDNRDTSFTLGSGTGSQIGDPPVAWLLDSVTDSSGNAVHYTWTDDSGALLPDTISWGSYELQFVYETRPDVLISGAYGTPIRTTQRCSAIELHVTTETVTLVRSWQLLYEDGDGLGRSMLATVREQGHGADGSVLAAPDRSFAYTTAGAAAFLPVTGWTASLRSGTSDLVDLNGDGLPDVLTLGAGPPTWSPNLGGGQFGFPQTLSQGPSTLRLGSANVAFADMSGEGNADLLVLDQPFAGYYPLSAPGGSEPTGFGRPVVFERAPNVIPADLNVRLLDLNGDSITDILYDAGGTWLQYIRESPTTWSASPRVLDAERTPPVALSDAHVRLGDMTGDGYTDIVRVDGGGVTYWPARADGGWDAAVTMSPAPTWPRNFDPLRLAVIDVDGDGCADLVYVDAAAITLWRNTGADRLSAPTTVGRTPLATPGSYRFVDLLGRGTIGIQFELPALGAGAPRQTFLDLNGAVKPGLLSDIMHGDGLSTHVSWLTSTQFAARDTSAGTPWPTYHPFPVQCVAQTDQLDRATGLTTTYQYEYHDGRYDPGTRVFLGFGRVDFLQVGDASAPTLKTETVFHLGLDPEDPTRPLSSAEAFELGALRRKVLQTTVWGLDGSAAQNLPYSVVTSTYATRVIASTLGNGQQIALPYTATTTEERWERQATVVSTRVISYLAISDEGDITQQRTTATRAGLSSPDQDVITTTTLTTGGRNIRLPARITQTLADGTVIGAGITYYDGDAYVGLPEGQATQGLESRVEQLVFTADFVTQVWGASPPELTSYGYHQLPGDTTNWWITRRSQQRGSTAAGPLLSTQGPLGAVQTVQLDAAGQHAVRVTDAVGNTVRATINPRVWQTESVTDQNAQTITDVFDELGRVTATLTPADTPALPWSTFQYVAGAVSTVTGSARIAHGQPAMLDAVTFLDGVGATLGKAQPAPTAGRWVVSDAVARNRRGLVSAAYLPYELADAVWQAPPAGTGCTSFVYDALGRVVSKTRADGLLVTIARAGNTLTFSEQWPGGAATAVEQQDFDAAGQLIAVRRNDGGAWVQQTYTYAPSGRVQSVTLPDGQVVTLQYDLLGRRFSHQSPDTGSTVYLLDACDSERQRTLATGQLVRTEVDVMNRVTQVLHDAETTPRIAYDYYDQGGTAPSDGITADRAGRPWQITDELGTVTLQYEGSGRITECTRAVAAGGPSYTESYSYDALGRTIAATLPPTSTGGSGRTVEYGYGADGHLTSASQVVSSAAYDLFGRPTSLVYGNGTTTTITYRPNGGTIARVQVTDAGGAVLRDVSVSVTDAMVTGLTSATDGDASASFGFDPLRRLTSADYRQGATAADTHAWSYDDNVRMLTSADAGALTYAPGTHRLASVASTAVTFDAAGRMATGRAGTMQFDASDHLNQLTTPAGDAITHTYAYNGLRAATSLAGTRSYLAPTDNVEVKDGQSVAWITFGPLRVAAEVAGELLFLHANALGGTDLISDASGAVAARVQVTPYGLARGGAATTSGSPAQTVAVLLSGADISGLVCQGQRWYDPAVGQFISPDPFITGIFTVGALNPYLFCLGNPIALSDPTGLSFWSVLEIIGIAILAAACVVAAIWTGGASLVALGVLTANLSTGLLIGVSVGALGGALAGEIAAQKAGGSIWAGAFLGALAGGACSLGGGVLGALAGSAMPTVFGTTILQYVVSGAVQGAIAGLGTGMAVGFAGGKGSAEQMLVAAALGAGWGASLGALLGLGAWSLVGNVPAGQTAYLQLGNIVNKYAPDPGIQGGMFGALNAADNDLGLGNDAAVLATAPGVSSAGGLLPDFVGVQNISNATTVGTWFSNGSILNISLGWVPSAALNSGAFAGAVNVSFAADEAGFSFADQVTLLLKAAPCFIDYALTLFQEGDNGDYGKAADAFNQFFGSADPNEYPSS